MSCATAAKIVKANVFIRCLNFYFEIKWVSPAMTENVVIGPGIQHWEPPAIKYRFYATKFNFNHHNAMEFYSSPYVSVQPEAMSTQMQLFFFFVGLPSILDKYDYFSNIC